jgi:acyl transferase domain-containing protein/acyl carrier protein
LVRERRESMMSSKDGTVERTGLEIAVIGMAGRFPGAANIDEFWDNLIHGRESIAFAHDEELTAAGYTRELIDNPAFVRAGNLINDKEYFDPGFFGYSPNEALVMDPQLRLFHQVSWAALEDAGYEPGAYRGAIGIYGGSMNSFEWQALSMLSGASSVLGPFAKSLLHNCDLMCHRISHRLNLRGPSITLFTACSTSLVALHLACRALVMGECAMALAGGVTASKQPTAGYLHEEGLIQSSDGHCRSFDGRANGTILGEGVGIVVLKRAQDALNDGDHIYALVKGSSVNNDGMNKVEFTAPSVKGQADVIRTAQTLARVTPRSIGYIEAHATATPLGDPIEISALKKVFNTEERGFCGIGTVKSNIGHLDTASGMAGFIKTVLALKHRLIPPTLHFETSNPEIDFANSPFYVVTGLTPWQRGEYPLRAGVSSFGFGGTNAHVVLEEAPLETGSQVRPSRPYQLIMLSAKTQTALEQMTGNLALYLEKNPGIHLADAAYTLQVGRKAFKYRSMTVCRDIPQAISFLSSDDPGNIHSYCSKGEEDLKVVFAFPGQGAQYVNMGLDLYETEAVFRDELDRCFGIIESLMDCNLKEILYPGNFPSKKSKKSDRSDIPDSSGWSDSSAIHQTEIAQPLLFSVEYALARLIGQWGIEPDVMLGHSIGEYVAACLAGVFSLEDALRLVVLRGRSMQRLPGGAMISVTASEAELASWLERNPGLSLAAVNAPRLCAISGPHEAIAAIIPQLEAGGYKTRRLHTSHAFHSVMIDPILEEFTRQVGQVKLNKPVQPLMSNVTGTLLTPEEAVDPGYWATHLRSCVRFSAAVEEVLPAKDRVFLEVGPGKTLTTFIRQHKDKLAGPGAVNLVRHPQEESDDVSYLLKKIGHLWLWGKRIDWSGFSSQWERHRVSLPAYPFQGQRYRIDPGQVKLDLAGMAQTVQSWGESGLARKADTADWFYVPLWEQALPLENVPGDSPGWEVPGWLIFMDEQDIGAGLASRLRRDKQRVVRVKAGSGFQREGEDCYTIDPGVETDYDRLFQELHDQEKVPGSMVHCWSILGTGEHQPGLDSFDLLQERGFYSLLNIVRAMGRQSIFQETRLQVLTGSLQDVSGEGLRSPVPATLLGAVKVIPLEYSHISCRCIDIPFPPRETSLSGELAELLLQELTLAAPGTAEAVVVLRGNRRWVRGFKPIPLAAPETPSPHLREKGVYLITGGFGGIGLTLARFLAATVQARLILTSREPGNKTEMKINAVQELEALGAEVIVAAADAADLEHMQEAVSAAQKRFGPVNGILHAVDIIDEAGVIQRRTREMTERSISAKVKGTLVLETIFNQRELDFFLLFSCIGSLLYHEKFAQVGYAAANAFLETFAQYKAGKNPTGSPVAVINWPDWLERGMVMKALAKMHQGHPERVEMEIRKLSPLAVTPPEGTRIFQYLLGQSRLHPWLAILPGDLGAALGQMNDYLDRSPGLTAPNEVMPAAETLYQRPELTTPYRPPANDSEKKLAGIFQVFLGIRQVGIHDDFFELGGNSLIAMNLLAMIHKEFDVKIPLGALFNHPTVHGLYRHLQETETDRYTAVEPMEKKEYYPLSPAQKRLFITWQMDPHSTGYNQPEIVLLEGKLEKTRLENAFHALIRRYEILRTSFAALDGEAVQQVHPAGAAVFALEYYQTSESEAKRIIDGFIKPFDLTGLPLFAALLVKIEEEKHILMLNIHHIISDGPSNQVFFQELGRKYRGEELASLKLQYKDFSRWHNRQMQGASIQHQEQYWLKVFSGALPVLQLPTDFRRPERQSFAGGLLSFTLNNREASALEQLARDRGATLFMVLLSLYNVMLAKISGQTDIVVGTPVSGAKPTDFDELIGMFVNTLALRNFPQGDKTFAEFLTEVRENTLKAFENQDYQFEALVETVVEQRDMRRNPLFDVMFVFQNFANPAAPSSSVPAGPDPGFLLKPYEYSLQSTRFDLILQGFAQDRQLYFTLDYCSALFKRERVDWFIKYFKDIVSAVLRDPGQKISQLRTLSQSESRELLTQLSEDLKN